MSARSGGAAAVRTWDDLPSSMAGCLSRVSGSSSLSILTTSG